MRPLAGGDPAYQSGGWKSFEAQTGPTGALTGSKAFDAFGLPVASTGAWQGALGHGGGFGYQSDDTGLQLLGHRYYDPSTGRFLTRDPIKDGPNWYAYCLNDPVNTTDPTGLLPVETIADAIGNGMDVKDLCDDPTDGWRWFNLGWSLAATVVPYMPGSWVKRGGGLVQNAVENSRKTTGKVGGRRGNQDHRDTVAEVEAAVKAENPGWKHIAGGTKPEKKEGNRFADLWFTNDSGGKVFYQIGRTNSKGQPVGREWDAGTDLGKTGDVHFIPIPK